MDHIIRQRLNEIRQKQLETQKHPQESTPVTGNNTHYLFALVGIAAGIIIAIIAWMVSSLYTTDDVKILMPESHVSIASSDIGKANDQIIQLNDHLELLSRSVYALEVRLNRVMELSGSGHNPESIPAPSLRENTPGTAGTASSHSANVADTSDIESQSLNTGYSFTPTHNVSTRLNLRPSASLESAPIATLSAGTKVEYIHEHDGWYYVNTELHGKGWCAAEYLTPLKTPLSSPQPVSQDG